MSIRAHRHWPLAVVFLAVIYGLTLPSARALAFPDKPINWIVPYSPGGGFDRLSRGISRFMQKHLGVPIVIKNAPGAGGMTGTAVNYRSRPDGHTIGIINVANMQFTQVLQEVQFDLPKMTWLGQVAVQYVVLVVPEKSPFRSIKDLQAAQRPARLAITGTASSGFYAGVITAKVLKIPFTVVSGFGGVATIMPAMLRGDVDWTTTPTDSSMVPFVQVGGLRILFYYGKQRSKVLPDVPTIGELGHPELSDIGAIWRGVAGPPGIPPERARILEEALFKTLKDPEFLAWAKKAGFVQDIVPASGNEFRSRLGDIDRIYRGYKEAVMRRMHQ